MTPMRKSTLVIARFKRVSLMIAHLSDVQPNNVKVDSQP
jgi:hypothetical protein